MTVKCCKCERVRYGEDWVLSRVLRGDSVSYSYCPKCLGLARREVWRERRSGRPHLELHTATA